MLDSLLTQPRPIGFEVFTFGTPDGNREHAVAPGKIVEARACHSTVAVDEWVDSDRQQRGGGFVHQPQLSPEMSFQERSLGKRCGF